MLDPSESQATSSHRVENSIDGRDDTVDLSELSRFLKRRVPSLIDDFEPAGRRPGSCISPARIRLDPVVSQSIGSLIVTVGAKTVTAR